MSGAPEQSAPARRNVTFHLTPFAPGVGAEAIGEACRWMTFLNVGPAMAVAHLCHRLDVDPADVTFVVAGDDIEVVAPCEAAGGHAVLALVAHGLELAELQAAIARIIAARDARKAAA